MKTVCGLALESILAQYDGQDVLAGALVKVDDGSKLFRLFWQYTVWSRNFDVSVASLMAAVADQAVVFQDKNEPFYRRDRSRQIAARVAFALRDEYGNLKNQKVHGTLVQAFLHGIVEFFDLDSILLEPAMAVNGATTMSIRWIRRGYGVGRRLNDRGLFRALGFHAASELLADQEFQCLDQFLRTRFSDLVKFLMKLTVKIDGRDYCAYDFIRVHLKKEVGHAAAGVDAYLLGFRWYVGRERRTMLRRCVWEGARSCAHSQRNFVGSLAQ